MVHPNKRAHADLQMLQAGDWWGVLVPEGTFRAPQGNRGRMGPGWEVMRELLAASAAQHPWSSRKPQLFFRGAAQGLFFPPKLRGALKSSLNPWRS